MNYDHRIIACHLFITTQQTLLISNVNRVNIICTPNANQIADVMLSVMSSCYSSVLSLIINENDAFDTNIVSDMSLGKYGVSLMLYGVV